MASSGTGSDISAQDAAGLLHKLITESTKVQAVFMGRGSVTAGVIGFVRPGPGGLVMVNPGAIAGDPFLIFDPRQATSFKYGDARTFPAFPPMAGTPKLSSALCFIYPDGVQVVLFEIAAPS